MRNWNLVLALLRLNYHSLYVYTAAPTYIKLGAPTKVCCSTHAIMWN